MNVFYGSDLYLIDQAVQHQLDTLKKNSKIFTYFLYDENSETVLSKLTNQIMHDSFMFDKQIIIVNDYHNLIFKNETIKTVLQSLIKYQNQQKLIFIKVLVNDDKPLSKISGINFFPINTLSQQQLRKWIEQKCNNYQVQLPAGGIQLMIKKFPKQLLFWENEIKKLANYQAPITTEMLEKICDKFFQKNSFSLIDNWLQKNTTAFWYEYRYYWEIVNVNNNLLFSNFAYYLELVRNTKLLHSDSYFNISQICSQLKINQYQLQKILNYQIKINEINQVLIKAYQLDNQIKLGKINKDIAIVLFFLNI